MIRDISIFWPVLFGTSVIGFAAYWALIGFGTPRVFIANDEEFDVRTHNSSVFRARWDEILEVRRTGRPSYEVITAKGSATVWWSPFHILSPGYPSFTYHLFRAMALGMRQSRLKAFRLPSVLEEGKTFRYSIPRVSRRNLQMGSLLLLLGAAQFIIKLLTTTSKQFEWIMPLVYLVLGAMMLLVELTDTRAKDMKRLTVEGDKLVIQTDNSECKLPFQKIDGKTSPSISPSPFSEFETYGDSNESIQIDRRFLVEITR